MLHEPTQLHCHVAILERRRPREAPTGSSNGEFDPVAVGADDNAPRSGPSSPAQADRSTNRCDRSLGMNSLPAVVIRRLSFARFSGHPGAWSSGAR